MSLITAKAISQSVIEKLPSFASLLCPPKGFSLTHTFTLSASTSYDAEVEAATSRLLGISVVVFTCWDR